MKNDLRVIESRSAATETERSLPDNHSSGYHVGEIMGVTQDGDLLVNLEHQGVLVCQTTASLAQRAGESLLQQNALIVFAGGSHNQPIAIDLIRPLSSETAANAVSRDQLDTTIDGEHISISARQKIELRCGKGAISIDKSGRITIRGSHLLSRSSGAVRIKGGHVSVN